MFSTSSEICSFGFIAFSKESQFFFQREQQLLERRFVAAVPHPSADFFAFDQAGLHKHPHVVGDGGLRELHAFLHVASAKSGCLADGTATFFLEQCQDLAARGIADCSKSAVESVGCSRHIDRHQSISKIDGCQYVYASPFPGRLISSWMASRGALPSCRMAYICSLMGISTLCLRARPTAAFVVRTPSATMPCMPATISGSLRPRPNSTPTLRLRDSPPVHVRTRSPMPERPARVSRRAPQATARRVISARPRVIRAATVLWPRPRPSQIPAAMAITFLSAPPSSTPATSSLV